MQSFPLLYGHYAPALWVICVVAVVALLIGYFVQNQRTQRLEARFTDLFDNASSDTMARMLADYLSTVRGTAAAVSQMKAEHDRIARILPSTIHHVGLVRFSPFHDTGGDQSFALALLDGRGDGVIVTGLHSRTESRLYAKPVEHGMSSYTLTPEEREAMDQAFGRVPAAAGH